MVLTVQLKFKVIYLKRIHSAKLRRLLQKVRYFAAGPAGNSWLGFPRHSQWRRKGARELRLVYKRVPGVGDYRISENGGN